MKPVLIAACAALALSGCATGYGGYDAGGFNAYYDDAYGPFSGGYWGRDNFFWYSPGSGRPFIRDDGRHFQRAPRAGLHGVHGQRGVFHRH